VAGRILVAEDNPINQLVTVRMLEDLGYATETVEQGRQAVEAVRRGSYALVLMDCHMPELDGFAATAAIRRHEREGTTGHRTPIVALTADAFASDADRCLAAGMDDYLAKPVTAERLRAVVGRWARAREARADTRALDPVVLEGLRAAGLLDDVVALFMRETPGQVAALRRAVESAEATALVEVAHRLKGSSAQLGATTLTELAAALQEMGETGAREEVSGRVDALEREFERVRTVLEAACRAATPG
jgi:CheY-like chemotaxis protein